MKSTWYREMNEAAEHHLKKILNRKRKFKNPQRMIRKVPIYTVRLSEHHFIS
jgi:hypothetical protein